MKWSQSALPPRRCAADGIELSPEMLSIACQRAEELGREVDFQGVFESGARRIRTADLLGAIRSGGSR